MPNETYPNVHSKKKTENIKANKFRWSSCFSFISTKIKKSLYKSKHYHNDIRLSKSSEEFSQKQKDETFTIEDTYSESLHADSLLWKPHHSPVTPSLSPPPRQSKSKRESNIEIDTKTKNRRPLMDPTLTPRVKPRSIKTKKQPSFLRLSLDSSPIDIDNDQYPQIPFRTGTLGAHNCSPRSSDTPPPPLPNTTHIPLDYTIPFSNISRPISQSTSYIDSDSNVSHQNVTDSPISISAIKIMNQYESSDGEEDDEEDKLTIKERRRRRSPLSIPNTDQLVLALDDKDKKKRQTFDLHTIYMNQVKQEPKVWRPQSLEHDLKSKSRQETMSILEGKHQPKSALKNVQLAPETPPYHQQMAPSLISSPSTPNSMDSSVLEQDHYETLLSTTQ